MQARSTSSVQSSYKLYVAVLQGGFAKSLKCGQNWHCV